MVPNKNNIWWYPGLRRMMMVPWTYKIPNFSFLNKDGFEKYKSGIIEIKKEAVPDTTAQNATIIHRAPVSKKQAAPLNQPTLF